MKQRLSHLTSALKKNIRLLSGHLVQFWRKGLLSKFLVVLSAFIVITTGTLYGVAQWYIASNADKPLRIGTTFIPAYAESLGLEPRQTMDAVLGDLGIRHLRLVSYWNQIEVAPGEYDFSTLDWQFEKAEQNNATISLSVGLRQPRWPECHMPQWATTMPIEQWQPHLFDFMTAIVERYKDSPSLESYQLENEYFLESFGTCTNFSRDRLIAEFNLLKKLDSNTPVIMSRSNNFPTIALGEPEPDIFGASVYKRVWSPPIGRYFEYPLPGWYYGSIAGLQKIFTGKDTIIHELQAEAWPPNRQGITETTLAEQNKSISAERLADRVELGRASGMRDIYLWGSEYWYYRMIHHNDSSLWETVKGELR